VSGLRDAAVARPWIDRVRPTRSLAARIVLLVVALLLVVQAASFTAIRASIDANARAALDKELDFAADLARKVLATRVARLAGDAGYYTRDFAFQTTLETEPETIASSLQSNALPRTGAEVAAVLDLRYRLTGAAGVDAATLAPLVDGLASQVERGERTPSIAAVVGDRPMQFVMVPVEVQRQRAHWLLLGFALGERLAELMHEVSAVQLVVAWARPDGGTWTAVASSVADDHTAAIAAAIPGLASRPEAKATIDLDGAAYRARLLTLGGDTAPVGGRVVGVVTRSFDEAVAPYRALQLGLAVLTALGVVAFAFGSVFTARHVTTPIRALAGAAERVGAGDYGTPIDTGHGADEIGDLARAFEHMRANIATHEEAVRRLAYWDALTGLPNRTQFAERVTALVADRSIGRAAVVMLDLDRFKHVNDVLGYAVGDLLLVRVADRLRAHANAPGAMLARLSGDEFAVLLPGADPETALAAARRIEADFAQPILIEDQTIDLSAGIGVACWPLHAADAGTLLSRAEVAMYAAKRRTTGPLLYDPAVDATSAQTLSLLSELRHAVDHGELRLFLQPKIALDSGRLIGAEALVRWQHPERGMVPPMSFIPFAEQTGFVRTLTMWILEEACRRERDLRDAGLALRLSVNLSTRDLVDQRLPERIEALVAKYGTPPASLCFEITESAIMDDPERAQVTLDRLHRRGFKLSIDDFGTGYSSLAYLKRLPVDELKIDKSFVFGMETDVDDAKIVRSTIDLAHNLSLTVVAEGVENDAVWKMLRQLSCDEGQGYHFAKPMAADQFIAWAKARSGAPVAAAVGSAGTATVTPG
jgi:diguanylate cyclase (GGDEF)-like protein